MPDKKKIQIETTVSRIYGDYGDVFLQSTFGLPKEIVKNVKVEPGFTDPDHFNCILTNIRATKLIFNFKLELSVYTIENKDPRKLIAVAQENVELEENKWIDLGARGLPLDHFFEQTKSPLGVIFQFEFEDVEIPDDDGPASKRFKPTPNDTTWLNPLSHLHRDENFKDLKFEIGEDVLTAHRLIIVTRSPVFYAMLQHDTKERREGVIEIKDCELETFEAFLNFCYTNEVDDMKTRAYDLLILAEKYGVEGLKKKCEDYLCGTVDWDNAISHLIAAHLSNSTLLKATIFNKIKPRVKEVLQSKDASLLNDHPFLFNEIRRLLGESPK